MILYNTHPHREGRRATYFHQHFIMKSNRKLFPKACQYRNSHHSSLFDLNDRKWFLGYVFLWAQSQLKLTVSQFQQWDLLVIISSFELFSSISESQTNLESLQGKGFQFQTTRVSLTLNFKTEE